MTGADYSFTPGTFVGTKMHFEGTASLKGQLLAINNLIDITNYTALKINVTDITLLNGGGAIFVMKGKIIDKSYGIIQEFDKTGIHEVNISGLSGDYYIGITVYNNASRTASIDNVWLE